MKNEKTKNINIELDEKTAQGQYSNLVVVNHSPTEFVLDFVNIMPGSPKAKVCSRLILTPQHAKKFLRAIGEIFLGSKKILVKLKVLNLKIFLSISAQKEKRS